jgi:hypothetical protein
MQTVRKHEKEVISDWKVQVIEQGRRTSNLNLFYKFFVP